MTSIHELPIALQQLLDEHSVLNLMARFDDAVIRQDMQAFRALWLPNAVWTIADPIPLRAEGIEQIAAALQKFHDLNEFFFRTTLRAVITLNGDRATARMPTTEYALRHDKHGYRNVGMWQDELQRQNGQWLFAARHYDYVWVDSESPVAGMTVAVPVLRHPSP